MIYDSIRFLCDRNKTVFFDAEHFFDGYKGNPDYALDTLRTAKTPARNFLSFAIRMAPLFPKKFRQS